MSEPAGGSAPIDRVGGKPNEPPAQPPLPVLEIAADAPTLRYANVVTENTAAGRFENYIIAHDGVHLGPYCVKCGSAAEFEISPKLTWYPRWLGLLLLGSCVLFGWLAIVLAIVILCIQKRARIHYRLCEVHRRERQSLRRWTAGLVTVGLLGLSFGIMLVISRAFPSLTEFGWVPILVGILCLLAGAIVESQSRPLKPVRIEGKVARLKGAGQQYLAMLPPVAL